MQVKTEQEEEFISNTLFKKIEELKKEKETLANNYEREEEFLTNDLSRKLQQIREEKHSLEQSLEQEQASQISQLMKRINRLEAETTNKQNTLVIFRLFRSSSLVVFFSGTIKKRKNRVRKYTRKRTRIVS
jgi:coiled-coil domain-containing protein 6